MIRMMVVAILSGLPLIPTTMFSLARRTSLQEALVLRVQHRGNYLSDSESLKKKCVKKLKRNITPGACLGPHGHHLANMINPKP